MFKADEDRVELSPYQWPGGYETVFFAREGYRDENGKLERSEYDRGEYTCCNKCAVDTKQWPDIIIVSEFVHWEGPMIQCEYCDRDIESEYGDPDKSEE